MEDLKLLNIVDEHTREALTIAVDQRIDADAPLARSTDWWPGVGLPSVHPLWQRPGADRSTLRDWCRFAGADTSYIEPGPLGRTPTWRASVGGCAMSCSPSKPSARSWKARVLVEDWWIEYNILRPYSALGYLTSTDYTKAWTANHPELS